MNEENLVQNIFALHGYRDFRVGVFYSDSPCKVLKHRSKPPKDRTAILYGVWY